MKSETPRPSLGQRLKIGIGAILWFVLGCLAALGILALANWSPWVPIPIAGLGILLAALVRWVRRRLARDKSRLGWGRSFLPGALASVLLLLAAGGLPIFYLATLAENRPLIAPLATLTDGERTLVIQGMSHVGSEAFYKSVVYDLENALTQGYTLFYEGVQPSPGEGDAWFATYLAAGGNLSANYKALSEVCGLRFQLDYFALLEADRKVHPERHVAADVSTLDMKREFDRLAAEDPKLRRWAETQARKAESESGDAELALAVGLLEDSTPGQRHIAGILCRGAFSILLDPSRDPADKAANPLDPVVLDYRNRALVERIVGSPAQKIYVTYGAEHVPGMLALLERQSKPWKVLSAKWSRTLSAPREYAGRPLPGLLPAAE